MMWYFWVWTGPSLVLAISSAIFGFGHIYLGLPQVLRTAAVGAERLTGPPAIWDFTRFPLRHRIRAAQPKPDAKLEYP